jgi:hypothetical protein
MSEPIKPALTPARVSVQDGRVVGHNNVGGGIPDGIFVRLADLGFTREDVALLRDVHREWAGEFAGAVTYPPLQSIIDRIEALLPPEEES